MPLGRFRLLRAPQTISANRFPFIPPLIFRRHSQHFEHAHSFQSLVGIGHRLTEIIGEHAPVMEVVGFQMVAQSVFGPMVQVCLVDIKSPFLQRSCLANDFHVMGKTYSKKFIHTDSVRQWRAFSDEHISIYFARQWRAIFNIAPSLIEQSHTPDMRRRKPSQAGQLPLQRQTDCIYRVLSPMAVSGVSRHILSNGIIKGQLYLVYPFSRLILTMKDSLLHCLHSL